MSQPKALIFTIPTDQRSSVLSDDHLSEISSDAKEAAERAQNRMSAFRQRRQELAESISDHSMIESLKQKK